MRAGASSAPRATREKMFVCVKCARCDVVFTTSTPTFLHCFLDTRASSKLHALSASRAASLERTGRTLELELFSCLARTPRTVAW